MRASVERRSRETRLAPSRAWSFECLGRFAQRTKKKEGLLVVYLTLSGLQYPPGPQDYQQGKTGLHFRSFDSKSKHLKHLHTVNFIAYFEYH